MKYLSNDKVAVNIVCHARRSKRNGHKVGRNKMQGEERSCHGHVGVLNKPNKHMVSAEVSRINLAKKDFDRPIRMQEKPRDTQWQHT